MKVVESTRGVRMAPLLGSGLTAACTKFVSSFISPCKANYITNSIYIYIYYMRCGLWMFRIRSVYLSSYRYDMFDAIIPRSYLVKPRTSTRLQPRARDRRLGLRAQRASAIAAEAVHGLERSLYGGALSPTEARQGLLSSSTRLGGGAGAYRTWFWSCTARQIRRRSFFRRAQSSGRIVFSRFFFFAAA